MAVCFNIKPAGKVKDQLKRDNFRKGMMLVDNDTVDPESSWEFEADVQIL